MCFILLEESIEARQLFAGFFFAQNVGSKVHVQEIFTDFRNVTLLDALDHLVGHYQILVFKQIEDKGLHVDIHGETLLGMQNHSLLEHLL